MRKVIFNPNKVVIDYRLTEGNCYAKAHGICPMENFNQADIDDTQYPRRNDISYCPIMAKKMLNGTLNPDLPVQIYLHKKCGHYTFSDGRHRTCITQHLHDLGINYDLTAYLYTPNEYCVRCIQDGKNKKLKPLSKKLQKIITQLDVIERTPQTAAQPLKELDCTIEMGNAKD